MKIAVLGGTGDFGQGLCVRLAEKHDIIVGSRFKEKAENLASQYLSLAKAHFRDKMRGSIIGMENPQAASEADTVIFSVPYTAAEALAEAIKPKVTENKVIISPIAPMEKQDKHFIYMTQNFEGKMVSMAELIAAKLGTRKVVAALQNVPAAELAKVERVLEYDVPLAGDDDDAVKAASSLIAEIKNLRPMYVGPLSTSMLIETLTPLLVNISIHCKIKNPCIKIVS